MGTVTKGERLGAESGGWGGWALQSKGEWLRAGEDGHCSPEGRGLGRKTGAGEDGSASPKVKAFPGGLGAGERGQVRRRRAERLLPAEAAAAARRQGQGARRPRGGRSACGTCRWGGAGPGPPGRRRPERASPCTSASRPTRRFSSRHGRRAGAAPASHWRSLACRPARRASHWPPGHGRGGDWRLPSAERDGASE